MGQQFTIMVQGKDGGVPADRLLEALSKTLAVLRDLDARNSEDGRAGIHWHITKATTNSPLTLTFTPRVAAKRHDNSRQVVRSCIRGMRKLESGRGIPSDFGENTLKEVRTRLGLLDRGLTRLEFSAPGEEAVAPTLRSAARIDEYFGHRPTRQIAETTIEGSLETVTVHGGDAFFVFDPLTGNQVRCVLAEGQLPRAIESLGKRVAVSGKAKFNDKGRPTSIEAESIRVMRLRDEIPSAADFEGEGRLDITGGIESAEFVRRLRDA